MRSVYVVLFFFSSRRRHTRWTGDWSSDVCSSDLPVLCEPFTQWVLEDDFADGRPPLEDAGVQIVPDVEPYELMKLRLLNASHQALCYPGYLVGYRLVHEVTTDPLFARFLLDYMTAEAIPTLKPVPGIDIHPC